MPTAQEVYRSQAESSQREQLILDHLDLVRHVVGRMLVQLPSGCDVENLESAGILGLVEAANHFEADRGVAFSTFAYPRVRGAILDELRRNCPLPQRVLKQISLVRDAAERLPHPATNDEVAALTNLTIQEVEEALEAMRLTRMQYGSSDKDWLSSVEDPHDDSPSRRMEFEESKAVLAQAISELSERERLVLTLYHLEELRLREIGEVVGLSESRVSRVLDRAEFHVQQFVRKAESQDQGLMTAGISSGIEELEVEAANV
jgi:RNA polymerase sigma factor for flagellar operon FliA